MTARRARKAPAPTLLTMRVTRVRDGRVIEQRDEVRITADDDLEPLLSSTWPPCQCPRHRNE